MPNSARICESVVAEKPHSVDREKGIIYGVKCLGIESKNGRRYSDQARQDAVKHYEGVEVNVDHPRVGDGEPVDRGMADGFGILRDIRQTTEGVFGDLHYLKAHSMADMIAERAERFPDKFGMSHVAFGDVVESDDGIAVVESLASVESVDIVRRPATNAGLFESHQGAQQVATKPKPTTVRKVLESNRKVPLAAAMLLLFEEEPAEFAAMAEAPVEVAADPAPKADDQVKEAFRSMVMAAFDDESLDATQTIAKIKDIMKAQEKLTAKPEKKEEPKDPPADSAVEESLKEVAKLKRQLAIREALDEQGVARKDLTEAQVRVLERCETKEHVVDMIESWRPQVLSTSTRPKRVAESQADESIDSDYIAKQLAKRK